MIKDCKFPEFADCAFADDGNMKCFNCKMHRGMPSFYRARGRSSAAVSIRKMKKNGYKVDRTHEMAKRQDVRDRGGVRK